MSDLNLEICGSVFFSEVLGGCCADVAKTITIRISHACFW